MTSFPIFLFNVIVYTGRLQLPTQTQEKVNKMDNKAIVIFKMYKRNVEVDLEIPLDITVNDLVNALNTAYDLGIDTNDVKNCYLKAENPIALLKGNKMLSEYGVRNGTVINFTD